MWFDLFLLYLLQYWCVTLKYLHGPFFFSLILCQNIPSLVACYSKEQFMFLRLKKKILKGWHFVMITLSTENLIPFMKMKPILVWEKSWYSLHMHPFQGTVRLWCSNYFASWIIIIINDCRECIHYSRYKW